MAAQLLEFPRPNQFHGGKPGQTHFKPQADHLAANQPTILTFMTARSWVIFKLFGVKRFCMVTWISFTIIKQYCIGLLHTYVWNNLCVTCKQSMTLWSVHCMMFMMTSSNASIFRVIGHLCGEFTGPLEGLISISAVTFICKVWCTHNYVHNEVWHGYVAQFCFSYKEN